MSILHFILEGIGAVSVLVAVVIIMSYLVNGRICSRKAEHVMYHGQKERSILSMLVSVVCALMLIVGAILGMVLLTACSTAPKPDLIPLQAEPVKAEKTTIQTWTDFFESRD